MSAKIETMTKDEWDNCTDAVEMIRFLWSTPPLSSVLEKFQRYPSEENWENYIEFERPLHKYYLASCREIWSLLPQEESRKGIELAEQYANGKIQWERVSEYNYYVEGAAFTFDYQADANKVRFWIEDIELNHRALLQTLGAFDTLTLLKDAAYFADYAMVYPSINPKGAPAKGYHKFLKPGLLKQFVLYPTDEVKGNCSA